MCKIKTNMVKIAVLGSGVLGIKIAGEFAYHGHRVKIFSNDLNSLNTVFQRIEEDKKYLRTERLMFSNNFVGQILCLSRLEETVNDAEFIFECIPDDLELKKDLFERTSHVCPASAVLATNSLRLNVSDIAERTTGRERSLGLRFLYPVYYIPEVEITPNKYTSSQTIDKVRGLLERMGKTLFFRSGKEPLILSEEQREDRKRARQQQLQNTAGLDVYTQPNLPALSQQGGHQGHGGHAGAPVPDVGHIKGNMGYMDGDMDCAICMDQGRDCVIRPCHHMVTCYACASMLINRRDGCPICRKDIVEILKVYSG